MNKKNIFLWTLYDFANSIVMIVFFLYFSQWLVIERGVSDLWYNMIFSAGSLVLIFTAPILGSVADKNGKQQNFLNWITVFSLISFLGACYVTLFSPSKVGWAILFFGLANYFYQFSFVFYNALLHYIAPKEMWGRVSGIGQTGNWIGQIVGLLITLPLASGAIHLFGAAGRAQTFLPSTILFFLLALPMILYFKLPKQQNLTVKISIKQEYKDYWGKFMEIMKIPNLGLFLVAFFFFNDAIITAATNFPIYLEKVFSVSDTTKSLILLSILITSAIGAFFSGFIADRVGLKKSLMFILWSWVIIFPAIGLSSNFKVFIFFTIAMGFMYGATWSVTRAVMTAICPSDKLNFGFSFYTLSERVSTLFGPLAWSLIIVMFVNKFGSVAYNTSAAFMAVFILIGIFFARKIQI